MSKLQNNLLKGLRKKRVLAFSLNASGISRAGLPDVLILSSGGSAIFVEVKEKGDRLSEIQKDTIDLLKELGYLVFIVRNNDQVKEIISMVEGL